VAPPPSPATTLPDAASAAAVAPDAVPHADPKVQSASGGRLGDASEDEASISVRPSCLARGRHMALPHTPRSVVGRESPQQRAADSAPTAAVDDHAAERVPEETPRTIFALAAMRAPTAVQSARSWSRGERAKSPVATKPAATNTGGSALPSSRLGRLWCRRPTGSVARAVTTAAARATNHGK